MRCWTQRNGLCIERASDPRSSGRVIPHQDTTWTDGRLCPPILDVQQKGSLRGKPSCTGTRAQRFILPPAQMPFARVTMLEIGIWLRQDFATFGRPETFSGKKERGSRRRSCCSLNVCPQLASLVYSGTLSVRLMDNVTWLVVVCLFQRNSDSQVSF